MITRYSICQPKSIVSKRFKAAFSTEYKPYFNAASGHHLPIITNLLNDRVTYSQWGLVPYHVNDIHISEKLLNARKETIFAKQPFCELIYSKRCIIPADGFFFWTDIHNVKTPYRAVFKNEEPFAIAGIWDQWSLEEGGKKMFNSFSMITTSAPSYLVSKTERIPLILPKEIERQWLNPGLEQDELQTILNLEEKEDLKFFKVSNLVDREDYNNKKAILEKDNPSPGMTLSLFD